MALHLKQGPRLSNKWGPPQAPPEKGRANEAVVALLADRLGIDPPSIAVVSGHGSPAKIVAVDGMDDEAIRQAFPREKPVKTIGMRNRE